MKVPLYRSLFSPLRKIINSVLISSVLLSFVVVGWRSNVLAQSPDHTVYLPLVSKNYQEWLDIFNQYRKAAGLNPVVANDSMNYGLGLHTNYMLLNPTQDDWHTEIEGKPGYTAEGKLAASQSNMLWTTDLKYTNKQAIDLWMEYFDLNRIEKIMNHRYHMLHPKLSQSGFSLKCDQTNCFAGLNIFGGLNQFESKERIEVIFPAANQQNVPPIQYGITWGFYGDYSSELDEVTLISSKIIDEKGNDIPHISRQPVKNNVYDYVNQIALYPERSFLPNQEYTVDITVKKNNDEIRKVWSFKTGSTP